MGILAKMKNEEPAEVVSTALYPIATVPERATSAHGPQNQPLCGPKTNSERIDDEARPRWRAKLWRRIAEPDERPAHPFATTDAF
jgi:hypothetical protein